MRFFLLSFLLFGAGAGCARKVPVASSGPGRFAVENARVLVERNMRATWPNVQSIAFKSSEIVVATTGGSARIPLTGQIYQYTCATLDGCDVWVPATWTPPTQGTTWHFWTRGADPANMRPVVDAFNELVARNLWPERLDDGFDAKAVAWRAMNPKPPLSDEGDKHRILAENAFREKNVEAAIEHFAAALESDPTWPDGNFNLALLYGETGEWRSAVRFMKRYLLLVPDSKDAKAAREKIVVWEDKASHATP